MPRTPVRGYSRFERASGPVCADSAHPGTVYLLTGQSNVSGRELPSDLTEQKKPADEGIQLYGNDERWTVAAEPLDSARGQIDAVQTENLAAVGPGLFFARAIRAMRKEAVSLVLCAKGGVSVGRWKPAPDRDLAPRLVHRSGQECRRKCVGQALRPVR